MNSDADGVADFLVCLSGLEDKNSQLFKGLSEKIVLLSVKLSFQRLLKIMRSTQRFYKT